MDGQGDKGDTQEVIRPEKAHNSRFPRMWDYIKPHIDADLRFCADLGCGRGDMVWAMHYAGASVSYGFDAVPPFDVYPKNYTSPLNGGIVSFKQLDIDEIGRTGYVDFSYVSCFSVLPYLKHPDATLKWMYNHSIVSLIECQYAGDGPGYEHIKTSDDMETWLKSIGWETVEKLGHTKIRDRDAKRDIWYCSKDSNYISRG